MPQLAGTAAVHGRIAYAPQSAWILTDTVRNNILLGAPFDAARYDAVVRACALDVDIANFPDGDATEIGERGVTLSGGQRARLSLARALYTEADVYLLDDPLSAVDTRVARILFEQAIRGFLRGKAVLLVTHHVAFARQADRLIVVEDGRITGDGTFAELIAADGSNGAVTEVLGYRTVLYSHAVPDANLNVDAAADAAVSTGTAEANGAADAAKAEAPAKAAEGTGAIGQGGTEDRVVGRVTGETYRSYFQHGGGPLGAWIILVVIVRSSRFLVRCAMRHMD